MHAQSDFEHHRPEKTPNLPCMEQLVVECLYILLHRRMHRRHLIDSCCIVAQWWTRIYFQKKNNFYLGQKELTVKLYLGLATTTPSCLETLTQFSHLYFHLYLLLEPYVIHTPTFNSYTYDLVCRPHCTQMHAQPQPVLGNSNSSTTRATIAAAKARV
jgi:hypothetical protein